MSTVDVLRGGTWDTPGGTWDQPESYGLPAAPPKKTAAAKMARAKAATPDPAETVAAMRSASSRDEAAKHLEGRSVSDLRAIAASGGIAVGPRDTKPKLKATIVQWTAGQRLDSEAISRPGPSSISPGATADHAAHQQMGYDITPFGEPTMPSPTPAKPTAAQKMTRAQAPTDAPAAMGGKAPGAAAKKAAPKKRAPAKAPAAPAKKTAARKMAAPPAAPGEGLRPGYQLQSLPALHAPGKRNLKAVYPDGTEAHVIQNLTPAQADRELERLAAGGPDVVNAEYVRNSRASSERNQKSMEADALKRETQRRRKQLQLSGPAPLRAELAAKGLDTTGTMTQLVNRLLAAEGLGAKK